MTDHENDTKAPVAEAAAGQKREIVIEKVSDAEREFTDLERSLGIRRPELEAELKGLQRLLREMKKKKIDAGRLEEKLTAFADGLKVALDKLDALEAKAGQASTFEFAGEEMKNGDRYIITVADSVVAVEVLGVDDTGHLLLSKEIPGLGSAIKDEDWKSLKKEQSVDKVVIYGKVVEVGKGEKITYTSRKGNNMTCEVVSFDKENNTIELKEGNKASFPVPAESLENVPVPTAAAAPAGEAVEDLEEVRLGDADRERVEHLFSSPVLGDLRSLLSKTSSKDLFYGWMLNILKNEKLLSSKGQPTKEKDRENLVRDLFFEVNKILKDLRNEATECGKELTDRFGAVYEDEEAPDGTKVPKKVRSSQLVEAQVLVFEYFLQKHADSLGKLGNYQALDKDVVLAELLTFIKGDQIVQLLGSGAEAVPAPAAAAGGSESPVADAGADGGERVKTEAVAFRPGEEVYVLPLDRKVGKGRLAVVESVDNQGVVVKWQNGKKGWEHMEVPLDALVRAYRPGEKIFVTPDLRANPKAKYSPAEVVADKGWKGNVIIKTATHSDYPIPREWLARELPEGAEVGTALPVAAEGEPPSKESAIIDAKKSLMDLNRPFVIDKKYESLRTIPEVGSFLDFLGNQVALLIKFAVRVDDQIKDPEQLEKLTKAYQKNVQELKVYLSQIVPLLDKLATGETEVLGELKGLFGSFEQWTLDTINKKFTDWPPETDDDLSAPVPAPEAPVVVATGGAPGAGPEQPTPASGDTVPDSIVSALDSEWLENRWGGSVRQDLKNVSCEDRIAEVERWVKEKLLQGKRTEVAERVEYLAKVLQFIVLGPNELWNKIADYRQNVSVAEAEELVKVWVGKIVDRFLVDDLADANEVLQEMANAFTEVGQDSGEPDFDEGDETLREYLARRAYEAEEYLRHDEEFLADARIFAKINDASLTEVVDGLAETLNNFAKDEHNTPDDILGKLRSIKEQLHNDPEVAEQREKERKIEGIEKIMAARRALVEALAERVVEKPGWWSRKLGNGKQEMQDLQEGVDIATTEYRAVWKKAMQNASSAEEKDELRSLLLGFKDNTGTGALVLEECKGKDREKIIKELLAIEAGIVSSLEAGPNEADAAEAGLDWEEELAGDGDVLKTERDALLEALVSKRNGEAGADEKVEAAWTAYRQKQEQLVEQAGEHCAGAMNYLLKEQEKIQAEVNSLFSEEHQERWFQKAWNKLGNLNVYNLVDHQAKKNPEGRWARQMKNSGWTLEKLGKVLSVRTVIGVGLAVPAIFGLGAATVPAYMVARAGFAGTGGAFTSRAIMDAVHRSFASRRKDVYSSEAEAEADLKEKLELSDSSLESAKQKLLAQAKREGWSETELADKVTELEEEFAARGEKGVLAKKMAKVKTLADLGATPAEQAGELSERIRKFTAYALVNNIDLERDADYQYLLVLRRQANREVLKELFAGEGGDQRVELPAEKMAEALAFLDTQNKDSLLQLGREVSKQKGIRWAKRVGSVVIGATFGFAMGWLMKMRALAIEHDHLSIEQQAAAEAARWNAEHPVLPTPVQHTVEAVPVPKVPLSTVEQIDWDKIGINNPDALKELKNLSATFKSIDVNELKRILNASQLHVGEGPEHRLIAQLAELEKDLDAADKVKLYEMIGYKPEGGVDLHTAIGRAAHRLAIQENYVTPDNRVLKYPLWDEHTKQNYTLGVDDKGKLGFSHDQATGGRDLEVKLKVPKTMDEITGRATEPVEPKTFARAEDAISAAKAAPKEMIHYGNPVPAGIEGGWIDAYAFSPDGKSVVVLNLQYDQTGNLLMDGPVPAKIPGASTMQELADKYHIPKHITTPLEKAREAGMFDNSRTVVYNDYGRGGSVAVRGGGGGGGMGRLMGEAVPVAPEMVGSYTKASYEAFMAWANANDNIKGIQGVANFSNSKLTEFVKDYLQGNPGKDLTSTEFKAGFGNALQARAAADYVPVGVSGSEPVVRLAEAGSTPIPGNGEAVGEAVAKVGKVARKAAEAGQPQVPKAAATAVEAGPVPRSGILGAVDSHNPGMAEPTAGQPIVVGPENASDQFPVRFLDEQGHVKDLVLDGKYGQPTLSNSGPRVLNLDIEGKSREFGLAIDDDGNPILNNVWFDGEGKAVAKVFKVVGGVLKEVKK